MTREEAIRELKIQFVGEYDRQREAKDMAIKALEQEPCEDAVSRQAVIDMTGLSEWFDSSDSYNEFVIALSELPPVIPKGVTITDFADKCRECGREKVLDKIRAEIGQLSSELTADGRRMIRRGNVFRIIDKHKTERRDKE